MEYLADFGLAKIDFLCTGASRPAMAFLDIVNQLVNDIIEADVHVFRVRLYP